jgi:hypothetical protein
MLALMRFSVEKVYEIISSRKAAKFISGLPKKYREKMRAQRRIFWKISERTPTPILNLSL